MKTEDKNYYIKTNTTKFYASNVNRVFNIEGEYCFYTKEDDLILCIPETELEYYFVCNQNRYNILPTDLKRGVVHL